MKKYLLLVYLEEKELAAVSDREFASRVEESLAYDEELRKSGHMIDAQALEPVATATTIRVRSGKMSTTDGPFAETKEQLGGFVYIHARDLNDALQVAARLPSARWGSVEVRPVFEDMAVDGRRHLG